MDVLHTVRMGIEHSYELRMTDTFILLLLFPTDERENVVGNSECYTTCELLIYDRRYTLTNEKAYTFFLYKYVY